MSESYGQMVGCETAIEWVEHLEGVNEEVKGYVLARMHYEFDKDIPVLQKLHKGVHGRAFDSYVCGNCGYGGLEPQDRYCKLWF